MSVFSKYPSLDRSQEKNRIAYSIWNCAKWYQISNSRANGACWSL